VVIKHPYGHFANFNSAHKKEPKTEILVSITHPSSFPHTQENSPITHESAPASVSSTAVMIKNLRQPLQIEIAPAAALDCEGAAAESVAEAKEKP
jgi:hypothetical protein